MPCPNIANEDVPIGKDDKENKLIKKVGKVKDFNFNIKNSKRKNWCWLYNKFLYSTTNIYVRYSKINWW